MNLKLLIMLLISSILFSCTNTLKDNPEKWSEEKLNKWFDTGLWHQDWPVKPDETIDKRQFAIQYFKNKERWEKAFAFPKATNLDTVNTGVHEIAGKDLYAAISEYTTKNDEEVRFEVHQAYADIQYVIDGEENINIMKVDGSLTPGPYNADNDVAFLQGSGGVYRRAKPDRFFIFFPDDAHRPGIKADSASHVRKLVLKLRLN